MQRRPEPFVTGLVLAAGGSRRLGRPKQLLPFAGGTLLGQTLATVRSAGFDQLLVALGGGAREVRARVDLAGADVVENPGYGSGCSSSIAAALTALDPRCDLLVLLLGDQPGVTAEIVQALLAGRAQAPISVCRYEDGRGHPLVFARSVVPELRSLQGDRAVWKLLERRAGEVAEVAIAGRIPRDVDTWEDYRAVLAAHGIEA